MGKISESHGELYHYTTAAGLSGILQSKSLWATHTSFMNDEEEILGFYDRVLPKILHPIYKKYIKEVRDNPKFLALIGTTPIERYCSNEFAQLIGNFKGVAPITHDHYVTSFSTTNDAWIREHGLLSQWRAYGPDGGYAIVFDTRPFEKLLDEEAAHYKGDTYSWADVQYELHPNRRTGDADTDNWIEILERASDKYFRSNSSDDLGELLEPLTILSTLFKHRGFDEEKEVRLVLSLFGSEMESHVGIKAAPEHPVKAMVRGGATVPFVELCVKETNGVRENLPIKKVIVGPHRDKNERKRAVQLLLRQHGVSAEVCVSDIPYRGK